MHTDKELPNRVIDYDEDGNFIPITWDNFDIRYADAQARVQAMADIIRQVNAEIARFDGVFRPLGFD